MIQQLTREQILDVLKQVHHADGQDVVSRGMISGVVIRGEKVGFSIEISHNTAPNAANDAEALRQQCEAAVKSLPGVANVTAVLTAEVSGPKEAPTAATSAAAAADTTRPPEARKQAVWNDTPLPGVKRIVAIASGKGGVGKSTTTVNLALALTALGQRAGILDADIFGPSIPRMMQLEGQPQVEDKKILPVKNYGVGCISMGSIAGDDKPVVWRGSMVSKALQQMMRGVRWATESEPLDWLLIDMPPGTGDVHLTIAQGLPLTGAIIVSTPQDVALLDAIKCLQMFEKIEVPILGMVENMSYFIDPVSGNRSDIFGHGGAAEAATKHGTTLLGEMPLDMAIRQHSDDGKPLVVAEPDHAQSQTYLAMAQKLVDQFA